MKPEVARRTRVVALALALAVALPLGAAGWTALRPAEEVVQGQVEVRRVNVAAKIPGRLDSLLVREGERVEAGQLLAVLQSPEITARAQQAAGSLAAARAQEAKARHGARDEEVRAARAQWERAAEATRLAETTFGRVEALFRDGVVAEQRRDETETQLRTARAAEEAARAQYDMALLGARPEDRAAATALVRQAEGGQAEVAAFLAETRIHAPFAGEVVQRVAEAGEIVASGYPILSIADPDDAWAVFHLREDRMNGLATGTRLRAMVPALGGREAELEVSYIAPVGEFATWRSTRDSGGFDLRTFEVRARPVRPVAGLRPGMSVVVPASQLRPADAR